MAEEHLRQLIYSFAQKGKIEPWEYQEIQAVAQRHNVSPARMQTLITEVVNSIDFQNLPKEPFKPKPENVISPFLKTDAPAEKKDGHILQPFQDKTAKSNEPQWVRSDKKLKGLSPEPEPAAANKSNTFKIVLLVILIVLSLYILLAWSQPERQAGTEAEISFSENEFRAEELEKFYNGLYYSNHKKSKTLLVLQLLQVDESRGRAVAHFQLNGQSYRERASIDFENHTIRIPKLGAATFYKTNNTVVIESNGSVNHWKIK